MASKVYGLSIPNNETENVNIYIVKLKCMIEFILYDVIYR